MAGNQWWSWPGRMNRLVAILRPYRLAQTRKALEACSGIALITAQEVRGYGMQKDHLESYSGDDVGMDFLPKIRLEVLVEENHVEEVVNTVMREGRTGRIGDGKIFLIAGIDSGRV